MTGRNLATWPIRLGYPGEENFNEGVQLAEMVRLRQGVRIYRPASPGQFDPANYGPLYYLLGARLVDPEAPRDRKSTRLNSSHRCISYAVFCLKKKKTNE